MKNLSKSRNIWKQYNSHILLAILTIIVGIITYYRVLIQFEIGPLSDSCDFLSDALVFAGQNMSYFDATRPPFFPFLISLIFRTGYVSTNIIFVLDGLMYIFGVIGLFFLFKLRFNNLQSFLGALLFAAFAEVITYVSSGFSDITGVSITIWMFYFLILAVKKDSKFFYLAFPFAMLAFLTRYNNALLIFPIFLYILINRHEIKNIKHLFTGMIASFLFIIPVFIFFFEKFGNMFYPFMSTFGTTSTPRLAESAAYDANPLFFIDKFPSFMGLEGFIAIFIILAGIFVYGFLKFKRSSKDQKKLFNIPKIKKNSTKLKLALFTVLLLIFVFSFGQILSYLSEVLFFILGYLFYDLTKNLNVKDMDMHLLFFVWFMAFFIFHSVLSIKDNRYFVIMAPPVAYFLIFGLTEVSNRLKFKIKGHNATFSLIALILTAIILLSAAYQLQGIMQANEDDKITNENMVLASQWLMNYDPSYKDKVIYSDLWPYFSWYLITNVQIMPVFMDGQSYSGGVKKFDLTSQDNMAYNKELDDNNADYYFCFREGLTLTYYKPIKQFGDLIIYKRYN